MKNFKSNRNKNYYQKYACTESFICKSCGHLSLNRIAADDSYLMMSVELKPITQPAFPLEALMTEGRV